MAPYAFGSIGKFECILGHALAMIVGALLGFISLLASALAGLCVATVFMFLPGTVDPARMLSLGAIGTVALVEGAVMVSFWKYGAERSSLISVLRDFRIYGLWFHEALCVGAALLHGLLCVAFTSDWQIVWMCMLGAFLITYGSSWWGLYQRRAHL